MTLFEKVALTSAAQKKSLKEPCYELGISCSELEQRLDTLEPRAVETVVRWLGVELRDLLSSRRDLGNWDNK